MDAETKVINAANEAVLEWQNARTYFGPMVSAHEGWAVLKEEMDELWEEVKGNKKDEYKYRQAMRKEAVQVAAMALSFIAEVCDAEDGQLGGLPKILHGVEMARDVDEYTEDYYNSDDAPPHGIPRLRVEPDFGPGPWGPGEHTATCQRGPLHFGPCRP